MYNFVFSIFFHIFAFQKENIHIDESYLTYYYLIKKGEKTMTRAEKNLEKRIEADKKKFAEDLENARVNYPEVYEKFMKLMAEAKEIEKKEGCAAALKHIVKAREEAVSNMMYDLLFNN